MEKCHNNKDLTILRVKDRFNAKSVPFGYRDMLMNVLLPNVGIICEIQLHWQKLYQYKKISHDMYKKARLFENGNDGSNLAYNVATKSYRPIIGNTVFDFQTLKQGNNNSNNNNNRGTNNHNSDHETQQKNDDNINQSGCDELESLFTKWGLAKYIEVMKEEGREDPIDWIALEDDDLKQMKFQKGHIIKFKRKYKEWQQQKQS